MAEKFEQGLLRILIVDDEANIRTTLSLCLEIEGHRVVAVGNIQDALNETARRTFDLIFLDLRLGMDNGLDFIPRLVQENPWCRVVVITAYASIETAVEAMRRGATDYLPKPFEPAQVQHVTQKVAERRQLERRVEALQQALGDLDPEHDFPTTDPGMQQAVDLARQVAGSSTPILIRGEPGTGKGRLARAIHAWSPRASAPFVSVTCQSSATDALEAELFGVTGSALKTSSAGRVSLSDGGTLLLDEISEMPMRLQPRIVRLAREKEFERQDDPLCRNANVRLVATTTEDLQKLAERGAFRSDLLMTFGVIEILLPSLRERVDDIPLLAQRYLAHFARQNNCAIVGFTGDAMHCLMGYSWPGNARELRNVVERAVLLCRDEMIALAHLPPNLNASASQYSVGDMVDLDTIEQLHIRQVVASSRSLRRAASILGIERGTLYRRLKRYGASDDQTAD